MSKNKKLQGIGTLSIPGAPQIVVTQRKDQHFFNVIKNGRVVVLEKEWANDNNELDTWEDLPLLDIAADILMDYVTGDLYEKCLIYWSIKGTEKENVEVMGFFEEHFKIIYL